MGADFVPRVNVHPQLGKNLRATLGRPGFSSGCLRAVAVNWQDGDVVGLEAARRATILAFADLFEVAEFTHGIAVTVTVAPEASQKPEAL